MALLNLKDVTVSRINNSGNGFSVLEENESRGKTYKQYFTIWADQPHGLVVGQVINVSGFFSSKVGDPKTGTDGIERRYVEVSVNSPRITTGEATQGQQTAQQPNRAQSNGGNVSVAQAGAGDVWNTQGSYNDETPF